MHILKPYLLYCFACYETQTYFLFFLLFNICFPSRAHQSIRKKSLSAVKPLFHRLPVCPCSLSASCRASCRILALRLLSQSGCLWRPWRWAASCSCCCSGCVGASAALTPAAATSAAGAAPTLAAAPDTVSTG